MLIEHKGLELSFELPDFSQRDVETFFKTAREIEAGVRAVDDQEAAMALVDFLAALKNNKISLPADQMKPIVSEFMANLRFIHQKNDILSSPEVAGIYARTCARLGWLGISEEDVAKLEPAKVTFISDHIQTAIVESYKVPPE